MMQSQWRIVGLVASLSIWTVLVAAPVSAQDVDSDDSVVTAATLDRDGDSPDLDLVFPINDEHRFINDWHFPRDGGARQHKGTDIVAERHAPVVAVTDGVIETIRHSNSGKSGNMVVLRDDAGWRYYYIHLNNDTPGTDDGANLWEYAFAPGLEVGARVRAGDLIAFNGDSGNAEGTIPHVHFGIKDPSGEWVNPYFALLAADQLGSSFDFLCRGGENPLWGIVAPSDTPDAPAEDDRGPDDARPVPEPEDSGDDDEYDDLDDDVDADEETTGDADVEDVETAGLRPVRPGTDGPFVGAPTTTTTTLPPDAPSRVAEVEQSEGGVRAIVGSALDVSSLGDAGFRSSLGDIELDNVVDIARTNSGAGFYLLDSFGDVQEFGDAVYLGSLDDIGDLIASVAIASNPQGDGYWILEANGRIHAFGNAAVIGSLGEGWLSAPLVDFAPTPDGEGLILVAEDGTVFAVGSAEYHGSLLDLEGLGRARPVAVEMTVTGLGYWILTDNGLVLPFGDAYFDGAGRGGSACEWTEAVGTVGFTDGTGVWVIADDLQAWAFGEAREAGPLRSEEPRGIDPPDALPVVNPRDDDGDDAPNGDDDGRGAGDPGDVTGGPDDDDPGVDDDDPEVDDDDPGVDDDDPEVDDDDPEVDDDDPEVGDDDPEVDDDDLDDDVDAGEGSVSDGGSDDAPEGGGVADDLDDDVDAGEGSVSDGGSDDAPEDGGVADDLDDDVDAGEGSVSDGGSDDAPEVGGADEAI